jgi:hypothetical protein
MRNDLLHVIGVYSNPRRYKARSRLLREWINNSLDSGVCLTVVEHAFGERPYEFEPAEPALTPTNLVQVRGGPEHELWLKEGLINYGISHLPETAKYVCWEDTDIKHERGDWAAETVHMLQHYRVGQTWTHSVDKDPNGNIARNEWGNDVDRSFCAAWLAGDIDPLADNYGNLLVQSRALLANKSERDWRQHYGYSWAIRLECFKGIGRLLDWMVTGSADYHMAMAFAGHLQKFDPRMKPGYIRRLKEFAARCEAHIKQDLGCVDGTIIHGWHGAKRNRFYLSRFEILSESGFDPDVDLAYDVHGLPTLISDNRLLRDGLRRYNMQRNEDSIDI